MAKQADPSTVVHNYSYILDGVGNRTQVVADPVSGVAKSNESDLVFNAANEISQIQPYSPQGQALTPVLYTYDAAGNQIKNNGGGTGKPLSIGYYPTNQTQSISDVNQNQETLTWAGAGQAERVGRTWTDQGTNYSATYTWSMLGLSGYSNTGIDEPTKTTSVTSWIVRMPDGTPVAQRYTTGSEYYYLFDGQGDVVGLEDPGVMLAAYDFCPTGNEADLASTTMTAVGLGNPLRLGAIPYDDLTKDYFGSNGRIWEDYSGTGTQTPAFANGGCVAGTALAEGGRRQTGSPGIIPQYMPNTGEGGASGCSTYEKVKRGAVFFFSGVGALGTVFATPLEGPLAPAGIAVDVGVIGLYGVAAADFSACFSPAYRP